MMTVSAATSCAKEAIYGEWKMYTVVWAGC